MYVYLQHYCLEISLSVQREYVEAFEFFFFLKKNSFLNFFIFFDDDDDGSIYIYIYIPYKVTRKLPTCR